jgi:hypothetical protein
MGEQERTKLTRAQTSQKDEKPAQLNSVGIQKEHVRVDY